MAVDIGPKIGIEGEREFRQQIAQTNQALKTLAAEGKAVSSAFYEEADAEKKSAAQMDLLNRQIETQKDKVALLEKGLMDSARMYGEADTRTMKWQQALHEATASLNNMENELRGMDGTVEDTSDAMEDAGNATKGWADVMKGQLLADAIKAGLKEMVQLAAKAASAFWDASKAGAAYADDMLTLSTVTGLSTEQLQKYAYAADFVDTSLDTITGSLTKLTSSMNKAREGEGDAAEVFAELGIAVTDANGQLRSANDVFNEALDALGGITNATERDAKAMTLFGKSAKELNPLIAAGSTQLSKLGKEAEKTGAVLSGSSLKALGAQQDAMDRLDKKAESLKNNFAAKMAPAMTRAYDTIAKTLDNPRVQRGLDLLANGLGRLIEKGAELAEKVLPAIAEGIGMNDVLLKNFTDAEIALYNEIDRSYEEFELLKESYRDGTVAVLEQTKHTEALWKELQNLADEEGHVDEANRSRANYILNELNQALGTEYSMNDGIIGQYRTMKKEIADLLKQRTAEELLAANEEEYAQALEKSEEAASNAGAAAEKVAAAEEKVAAARQAKDEAWQAWKDYEGESDYLLRAYQTRLKAYNQEVAALRKAQNEYSKASEEADEYYSLVATYQMAEQAMLEGNYSYAVQLLSGQMGATNEYYRQKKELSEEDRAQLTEQLKQLEYAISYYRQRLSEGAAGYTEEGLSQLEEYARQARRILNGEDVAWEWLEGLKRGLGNQAKLREVGKAAATSADKIVQSCRDILLISSPSKVAAWIGEMWDQGLIKGMEDREDLVAKAASGLADTLTAAGTPDDTAAYTFGNDLTASGGGWAASSASYTTNLGGITVRIDGAGEVNEDLLAARVAVRLTDELIRAQRGGRL